MVELTAEERAALEPAGASQDLTPEEQAALAPAGGASGLTPEELAALQPAGQGLPLAPSASPMISQAAKDEFGATGPGFMLGLGGKALQSVAGAAQGFEQMISDPTTLAQRTVWNPLAAGLSQATVPLFGKEVKQIPMPERYQQIMQGSQGATNIPAVDTALGGAAVGGRAAADLIMSGLAATGMSPAAAGAAFGVPAVLGMTGLPEGIEKTQSSLQDVANEQIRQLSAGEVQGWDAAKANLAGAGAAALSGMGQSAMEVAPLALGVAGSTARQGAAVRPQGTVVPPVEPGAYPMAKGPGPGNSIPGMLWDATAGKTAPGRWLEKQVTPSLDVLAQKSPQTAQAIRRQQEIGTLLKSYQDELFTKANALDPFSDQRVLQLQRSVPPARFGKRDAGGALVPEEYARLVNDPAFLAKRMQEYELDALRTLGDDTMAGSEDLHRLAARYVAFNRISEDLGGMNTKQLFNAPLEGAERTTLNKAVEATRPSRPEWSWEPVNPRVDPETGQVVAGTAGYGWKMKGSKGPLAPGERENIQTQLSTLEKELSARTRQSTEEKMVQRQKQEGQVAAIEQKLGAEQPQLMPLGREMGKREAGKAVRGESPLTRQEIGQQLQEGVMPETPDMQKLTRPQVSDVLEQGVTRQDKAYRTPEGTTKILLPGEKEGVQYQTLADKATQPSEPTIPTAAQAAEQPKPPMTVMAERPTFERRNEVQPLDMPATPAEKVGLEKAAKQLRASVEGPAQNKSLITSLESLDKGASATLQETGLRMKRDALLTRLKNNRPLTDVDLRNLNDTIKEYRGILEDASRTKLADRMIRDAYVDTVDQLTKRVKQAGAGYSPQVNKARLLETAQDLADSATTGEIGRGRHQNTFSLLGVKGTGQLKVKQRELFGNQGYTASLKQASAANQYAGQQDALRAGVQAFLRTATDDPTIVQPDLGEASNKLLSKGWVRIEDNPRVPKLLRERYAGRLIHEDLARALYDTEPNKLSKLVSEWSKWVAVGNPGSSVANAAGSIALTDLYFGISPLESATKGGFTGLKALKGRYQEELRRFDFGSLGSDEIQAQKKMNLEMAQLEQAKEAYRLGQQAGDGFFGGLLAATTAIDKGLAKAAEGLTPVLGEGAKALSPNDLSVLSSLFEKGQKAFIYETLRDQGYTMDQAAASVRKGMVDYGDFSRFETAMRNYALGGFGSRFAKFTTASMRNAIQVALNPNPRVALRFWKYPLAIAAWNDAVQQANGESDDDRVQREVQGWAGTAGYRTEPAGVPFTFGPQMFRVDLPTGAEPATPGGGKEVRSVDLYRWVPGNMGLDIVGGVEAMQSGRITGLPPVVTRFAQLNPGAQTLMELLSGNDLYTGEKLTEGATKPWSPYNLRRIYNAVSDVALPVQLGRLPNRLGENEAMLANPLASNFRRTRPERNDILAAQALGARVQTDNPAARKLAASAEGLSPIPAGVKFLKKGKTTTASRINVQAGTVDTARNRIKALFPRSEK